MKIYIYLCWLGIFSTAFGMKRSDEENPNTELVSTIHGRDFSDFIIETPFKEFACSKAALFNSAYFQVVLESNKNNTYYIDISDIELPLFAFMLYVLHDRIGEKFVTEINSEEFLKLYGMSKIKFGCLPDVLDNLIESYFLSKKNDFIKDITKQKLLLLNPPQEYDKLRKNKIYHTYVFEPFTKYLTANFKSTRDFYSLKNLFIDFPHEALIFILSNSQFATDTENSVFFMLMTWLNAQKNKYEVSDATLEKLLSLIEWNDLTLFYFENIVSQVVFEYPNPIIGRFYAEEYTRRANKNPMVHTKHRPRIAGTDKELKIKCVFRELHQLAGYDNKLYSIPVLSNGYELFIFIQTKIDHNGNHLGVFLKCELNIINKREHELPLRFSFKLVKKDGSTRAFAPIDAIFINANRAFGHVVSVPGELAKILNNELDKSDLIMKVADGSTCLTIIANVEFLDLQDIPAHVQLKHVEPFIPHM